MNKSSTIMVAIFAVVMVAIVAVYIANDRDRVDTKEYIEGDWNLVSEYVGTWMNDAPVYSEDTTQKEKVTISHFNGNFYIFDTGDKKLYCSWDGKKMVTSGMEEGSSVAFIMGLPEYDDNFMLVIYFVGEEGVIKLYKREGYTGEFSGLSIPIDVPKVGDTMESFKIREYTPEGPVDHGINTLTVKDIKGRMLFYDVLTQDESHCHFVCIYLGAYIFMSMGVTENDVIYNMAEYRGGVLYCSAVNRSTGNEWVIEYGDKSSADYPDKNISGHTYVGSEDYVIYKDGKVVEQDYYNGMNLKILMQDDECLSISTIDVGGSEIARWTSAMTDLRPLYHYGISVQSLVEYEGKQYYGWYFGYFSSKDCEKLSIYGALTGDDGSCVVISQHYNLVKTE